MNKRTLIYRLIKGARWVFVHTPRDFALLLGSSVGLALWFTQRKDKFRAARHLSYAYQGKHSIRHYNSLAREAFINSGYNLCDTFRLRNKYESEIAPLIDVIGLENVTKACKAGKGVICATGHIGNFELLAAYMGRNGFKTAVIGRELYDKRIDKLLVENRQANNIENILTTEPRKLVAKLREGYVIGVLLDNDSHRVKSAHVESYGRLANTPIAVTHIALRLEAKIVPVTCRRIGKRYLLKFSPAINVEQKNVEQKSDEPEPASSSLSANLSAAREQREMRALTVTAAIRKALDREVDKDPSQWTWVHNRWRTKPF